MNKMVCSYATALDLQRLGIKQVSMFYWIFYENTNVTTIRLKTNLPEKTDENALIASAFTSQELFVQLLKVHPTLRTDAFMKKLALNGDNPNYLAKLLCRSVRKVERSKARKISLEDEVIEDEQYESTIS